MHGLGRFHRWHWPKKGEADCSNSFACEGLRRCPSWPTRWGFPNRRSAAIWISSKASERPSGRTAACFMPAAAHNCRISTNDSRPNGTRNDRSPSGRASWSKTATRCCSTADRPPTKWPGCWSAGRCRSSRIRCRLPICLPRPRPRDLVVLGGYVYPRTGVTLGPYANEMLAGLSVRKTILSVAGINERGFFNSNVLLVETERAMMRRPKK